MQQDLEAFRRTPRDQETIEGLAKLLDDFKTERIKELASRLAAEARPLPVRLERLAAALAAPLKGEGLAQALEERRAALVLEVGALLTKAQTLTRQGQAAARALVPSITTQALLSALEEHHSRLAAWQESEALLLDLEQRVDGWLRWAEWVESAPLEAHPAGMRALLEKGLQAEPPAFAVATTKPPSEPPFDFDLVFPEPDKVVSASKPAQESPKPSLVKATPTPPVITRSTTALELPGFDLLDPPEPPRYDPKALELITQRQVELINNTLKHHGVEARVVSWSRGPTVTRYELEPAPGEKISRVQNLHNDLALALAAGSVRIEAPIPGKSVIGLEVPNTERELVRYSEAIQSSAFTRSKDTLPLVLGKSIDGEVWVRDLAKMPHLLIAGSTGSGKSVAVNTLIASLLFKYLPTELRFLMIDPKMVELTPYEGIPHLVRPVVTNPADAAGVLLGAVAHMERRYKMMSQVGARNLEQFNQKMRAAGEATLPYLVIVIDEAGRSDDYRPQRGRAGHFAPGADGPGHRHAPDSGHPAPLGGHPDLAHQGQYPGPHGLCGLLGLRLAHHPGHLRGRAAGGAGRYALPPAGPAQAGASAGPLSLGNRGAPHRRVLARTELRRRLCGPVRPRL